MGVLSLWIAIFIFAASNSVVAKLGLLGAMHTIHGRNPISFCNLLFAGNILAGIVLLIIYIRSWRPTLLARLKIKDWWNMFYISIIAAVIAPPLFFFALMSTEVINVVLISTLEIPLTLIISYLFFREKSGVLVAIGATLALLGVIATFVLHEPTMAKEMQMKMLNIGDGAFAHWFVSIPKIGEICAALGTFIGVIATALSRKALTTVPAGIFSVFRMLVGSIAFFIIVVGIFGFRHFQDLASPWLWEWMALYGGVIIVLGQIFWYRGIQDTDSGNISVASAFSPIAGILFAFIILGELPKTSQIIGGAIILCGIAVGLWGVLRKGRLERKAEQPASFTGV